VLLAQLKTLFRHSAIYGAADVFGTLVNFLLLPILTRHLTSSDYGTLGLLLLLGVTLKILFRMGLDAGFFRIYYEQQNERDQRVFTTTILATASIIGIGLFVLSAFLAEPISRLLLGSDHCRLIVLVATDTLLMGFAFVPMNLFRIEERAGYFTAATLFRPPPPSLAQPRFRILGENAGGGARLWTSQGPPRSRLSGAQFGRSKDPRLLHEPRRSRALPRGLHVRNGHQVLSLRLRAGLEPLRLFSLGTPGCASDPCSPCHLCSCGLRRLWSLDRGAGQRNLDPHDRPPLPRRLPHHPSHRARLFDPGPLHTPVDRNRHQQEGLLLSGPYPVSGVREHQHESGAHPSAGDDGSGLGHGLGLRGDGRRRIPVRPSSLPDPLRVEAHRCHRPGGESRLRGLWRGRRAFSALRADQGWCVGNLSRRPPASWLLPQERDRKAQGFDGAG